MFIELFSSVSYVLQLLLYHTLQLLFFPDEFTFLIMKYTFCIMSTLNLYLKSLCDFYCLHSFLHPSFISFLFVFFFYLENRDIETNGIFFKLLVLSSNDSPASVGPTCTRELRTQSKSPMWMAGLQAFEPKSPSSSAHQQEAGRRSRCCTSRWDAGISSRILTIAPNTYQHELLLAFSLICKRYLVDGKQFEFFNTL